MGYLSFRYFVRQGILVMDMADSLGVDVLVSGADASALAPGVLVGGGATKIESHPQHAALITTATVQNSTLRS